MFNLEKEYYNLLLSKGISQTEARNVIVRYYRNYMDYGNDRGGEQCSYNCFSCGGFYAPTFGQPLCSVCHSFLWPDPVGFWSDWAQRIKYSDDQKSESDDSGNEDLGPTVGYGQKDGTNNTAAQSPADPASSGGWIGFQASNSGDDNSSFAGMVQSPPPDRLAEHLKALSEPRSLDRPLPEGLVDRVPAEVLTKIFGFMDDLALWCCSRVSKRWETIVKTSTTSEQWQHFVQQRWPLVKPFYTPVCWYKLYGALVKAAPCFLCLERMNIDTTLGPNWPVLETDCTGTNLGSKRLMSEVRTLRTEAPVGVEARPLNRQCSHWLASVTGPANSPYEGGKFLLFIKVPSSYPMTPPSIKFLTRIFHPNVSRHGDIGLDVLHHNWSLALTLSKILLSIQSLLTDPTPTACMEPEIGHLYTQNRRIYNYMAQMWTWRYAMFDILTPSLFE